MKTRFSLKNQGFTLIELIITIVIIGILAAVAIPKFVNLSDDAERGVALGIAGAAASASSVYYARTKANSSLPAKTNCADLATEVDMPAGYAFTGTTGTGGTTGTCTVTKTGVTFSPAVTFQAYGA
jgi:MSHA pilin protein MshA